MRELLRISGKNLGALALADYCERCAWLKLRLNHQMPYSIFPGIFGSIDSYTKHIAHAWFDHHGRAPVWLAGLGDPVRYVEPPHWAVFQTVIEEYDVLLTGAPDGVFVLPDGTYLIADYKTARYTSGQDALLPMYEAQLNAYALIAERTGIGKVSRLGLVYFEPPICPAETCRDMNLHRDDGFLMQFTANVHEVGLDKAGLDSLLAKARGLFDQTTCPAGRRCCKDCQKLDALIAAASA